MRRFGSESYASDATRLIVGTRSFSSISIYCSESMVPTILTRALTPGHPIGPHTIIEPPPNLTVAWIIQSLNVVSRSTQPYCRLSEQRRLVLVSSD